MILLVFLGLSTYENTNSDSTLNSDELKLSADGQAEIPCWTNLPLNNVQKQVNVVPETASLTVGVPEMTLKV